MKDSSFVDTAPFTGIEYCGLSWESAFLTTQYYLYLYYKDINIVKELYAFNKKWMDKVAMIHPEGIVSEGLSDHESLEPVPVELTGTCHYLQCAEIMTAFAGFMGNTADVKKYEELAQELRNQLKAKFWDQPISEKINLQTLFSTLLYHDIIPHDEIPAAKDSLFKAVENGPSSHFNTGIFGTKYILETLAENGGPNAVFDIVNSTKYPGWGFMIDQGATTIWETWKESDDIYSNNHPMFGTVSEWFYRWLAGIRPDPAHPGFKEFFINPTLPQGLKYVNCTYHSPYGEIVSNWNQSDSGTCVYDITIPKESLAKIHLTILSSQSISIFNKGKEMNSDSIAGLATGKFSLSGGNYVITVN